MRDNQPLGLYDELRAKSKQFETIQNERKRMLQVAAYVPPEPPRQAAKSVVRPPAPVKVRDGGYYKRHPGHKQRRRIHHEGTLGITMAQVIEAVCLETGLSWNELLNDRRIRRLAYPRHAAWYLIDRYCPEYSLSEIARTFHRDHTSVMYGIRMATERLADDDRWTATLVADVHQRLTGVVT